jgi:hypothetical protein
MTAQRFRQLTDHFETSRRLLAAITLATPEEMMLLKKELIDFLVDNHLFFGDINNQ